MAKHTPGPWMVEREADGQYIVSPEDPHAVAICRLFGTDESDPAHIANAHLIAVVPEILEQLEILIEVVGEAAIGVEASHSMIALYLRNQVKIAQDVITKATGGENV